MQDPQDRHRGRLHDWNGPAEPPSDALRRVKVCDETLRDGLQGGVPRLPTITERARFLEQLASLGVDEATVGLAGREDTTEQITALAQAATASGLTIRLGVLGRMHPADICAIDRVRAASGARVAAWLFAGSSALRQVSEGWDPMRVESMVADGLALARRLGLPVNFGLEDSARADPTGVERLIAIAAEHGVEVITVCDTAGHLTPSGTARALAHYRRFVDDSGYPLGIDFHGHDDRGLALANSLAACLHGADRAHGTALGLGERAGNACLELLLVNLSAMGLWTGSLRGLPSYSNFAAEITGTSIPDHFPVVGRNAFRTQAGVHAAAQRKAARRFDQRFAAAVYGGVDPELVGQSFEITVGPASGRSNVLYVLERLGIEPRAEVVERVLRVARCQGRTLETKEILTVLQTSDS